MNWLDKVKFDRHGLIPVIAQEVGSNDVLMFAWMNREALSQTAELGRAVYYSRSRAQLWHKGEESGNVQTVHEIRMDCDSDVLLLRVSQPPHTQAATTVSATGTIALAPSALSISPGGLPAQSIACHTGRHSCFFSVLVNGEWQIDAPVLKDPQDIYK